MTLTMRLMHTRFIPLDGTPQKLSGGTYTHTNIFSAFVPPPIFCGGTQKVGHTHSSKKVIHMSKYLKFFTGGFSILQVVFSIMCVLGISWFTGA